MTIVNTSHLTQFCAQRGVNADALSALFADTPLTFARLVTAVQKQTHGITYGSPLRKALWAYAEEAPHVIEVKSSFSSIWRIKNGDPRRYYDRGVATEEAQAQYDAYVLDGVERYD